MAKKAKKVEVEEPQLTQEETVEETVMVEEQPEIRERLKPANEWEIKDRIYYLKGNKKPLSRSIKSANVYYFDPEKGYRVFIVDALKSKHLTYKNTTFMYGKEAIGTNEEQVIVWLKEHKDIFALIKHELRGEEPKKTSKKTKVKA